MLELLVIVFCVGLLFTLIISSIGQPTELARRTQCSNNMRQIGIGLMQYYDVCGRFPAAMNWRDFEQQPLFPDGRTNPNWNAWATDQNPFVDTPKLVGANWMIAILPFTDRHHLYEVYNSKAGVCEAANMTLRSCTISDYLCPADENNRRPMTSYKTNLANDPGWGRSNYGATGAIWLRGSETVGVNSFYHDQSQHMYHPSRRRQLAENRETIRNSVMGFNGAAALEDIVDGAHKTVMVWELTSGSDPADPRGTWALGKTGSSIVGACWNIPGSNTTCNGINSAVSGDDDVKDCIDLPTSWSWSKPKNRCNNTADRKSAPRSFHKNGVHGLFADGHVEFMHQKLDQNIGQALDTIMGDEEIPANGW